MTIVLDPGEFGCRKLVAELADEWVEFVAARRGTDSVGYGYRTAVRNLANWVNMHAANPESVSLADADGGTAGLLREWARQLPSGYAPGSTTPSKVANAVRTLIRSRGEREGAVLAEGVRRWAEGPNRVPYGRSRELDEFSRAEKQMLVRAAWADVRAMQERLEWGRALLASAAAHPEQHGSMAPARLLAELAQGRTPGEITSGLPHLDDWPIALRRVAEMRGAVSVNMCRYQLAVSLANLLYPRAEDLHAFRVLLVAATGHAPEEIRELRTSDVEFTAAGVRLRLVKRRAHVVRHRSFPERRVSAHADGGTLSAPEIIRRLLAVTERARRDSGLEDPPLLLQAAVAAGGGMRMGFRPMAHFGPSGTFGAWIEGRGLDTQVSRPWDLRRMRKSVKVEKAIAMRGVVSDIADDHTAETFHGHYAHGTTLHVISGQVINTAQHTWLQAALKHPAAAGADADEQGARSAGELAGPVVLDEQAASAMRRPEAAGALGLSPDQGRRLGEGGLDMGVTSCRDPFTSPYSKEGDLCAVAPLRCLECRNALILPSNLPQLLLFADHLEQLRRRLPPRHFHRLWGQSHTNLTALLGDRTEADLAAARHQIGEQSLELQLPLSARTEFDL